MIRTKLLRVPLLAFIWVYRLGISPFTASSCRYAPTCSAYASEAIEQHGIYGLWLALKRISRCHPWAGSGYDYDPVPQKHSLGRKTHAAPTAK